MEWDSVSTSQALPWASTATPLGPLRVASLAGPPLPVNPFFPFPAMWVILSAFRSSLKTWLPSRVQTQRLPAASKSIERGPRSGVPFTGAPSGVAPGLPVPAMVLIRLVFISTLRITWLPMSQMNKSPWASNWILCGCFSWA